MVPAPWRAVTESRSVRWAGSQAHPRWTGSQRLSRWPGSQRLSQVLCALQHVCRRSVARKFVLNVIIQLQTEDG